MVASSLSSTVIESYDGSDPSGVSSLFLLDEFKHLGVLAKVKGKLLEMNRKQNNISFIYKETLRAMIYIMGNFYYLDSENRVVKVKAMHANPERAVAKIRELTNMILPIITVSQTTTDNNKDRQKYSSHLIHDQYWDEDKQRAVRILSFCDRAVDINYKINIWAKYREDMDQILEQIRLMFNPTTEIPTMHSTQTKGLLVSESDISDVAPADGTDRLVRKEIVIKVETYIPSPRYLITSTGEIEKFNTEAALYK